MRKMTKFTSCGERYGTCYGINNIRIVIRNDNIKTKRRTSRWAVGRDIARVYDRDGSADRYAVLRSGGTHGRGPR